jgi:hypothetical protein
VDDQLLDANIFIINIDWYGPIREYFKKGYFKDDIPKEEKKSILIKAQPYTLQNNILYKLRPDGVLRQCLHEPKVECILSKFHEGRASGHYGIHNII